jgi:hypothetical protein
VDVTANTPAPRRPETTTAPTTTRPPRHRASLSSFFGLSASTSASNTSLTPYRKRFAGRRK